MYAFTGELMTSMHVDHVIPRQIINHDEIWNLVMLTLRVICSKQIC